MYLGSFSLSPSSIQDRVRLRSNVAQKAAKVVEFVAKWLNLCLSTVSSDITNPDDSISNTNLVF